MFSLLDKIWILTWTTGGKICMEGEPKETSTDERKRKKERKKIKLSCDMRVSLEENVLHARKK